jgi:uncharacterized protein with ParB-like and HNH nuclease domain
MGYLLWTEETEIVNRDICQVVGVDIVVNVILVAANDREIALSSIDV